MKQTLLLLVVIIVAAIIYWPILKKARVDIAARTKAGLSNGGLYAVLMIPLVGPFVYLLFRRHFSVE